MCDHEPIDAAKAWEIVNGVKVSRSKRVAKVPGNKDQHVLTFARHAGLLDVVTPRSEHKFVPPEVLENRASWVPFLAGLFDGDGYVRKQSREIVFVSISALLLGQVYSMLADLGVCGHHWSRPSKTGHSTL